MNEDTARKLMGGAALAAAIGTFLPWASILFATVSGTEADRGQVALGACIAGGLLLLWRDAPWWLQLIPSTLAGGMAVWFWWDVASTPAGTGLLADVHARTGAGVYLTVIASVVWICIAGRSREQLSAARRSRRDAAPAA